MDFKFVICSFTLFVTLVAMTTANVLFESIRDRDKRLTSNRSKIILVSKRDMRDQTFRDKTSEIFVMRNADFADDVPVGAVGNEYVEYDLYDDVVNRDDGFNDSAADSSYAVQDEGNFENDEAFEGDSTYKVKNQIDDPEDLPTLLCIKMRGNNSASFFECMESDEKDFLCLDAMGYVGPCRAFPNRTTLFVPLCVLKQTSLPYIVSCYAPGNEKFCTDSATSQSVSIVPCNDESRRLCFADDQEFQLCKEVGSKQRMKSRQKRSPKSVHLSRGKPYKVVNCQNCEVRVKMIVDEAKGEDAPPQVDVEVIDLEKYDSAADDDN